MQTTITQTAGTWDSETGAFISESHKTLASVLHDYRPTMKLCWIPPKDRDATDVKPWAIVDNTPQHGEHVVRYLSDKEMENTQEVLAWVFAGDMVRHGRDAIYARIEAAEAAKNLLELRRQEEELESRLDFIAFAAKTPLNTFRHNGVTFRS